MIEAIGIQQRNKEKARLQKDRRNIKISHKFNDKKQPKKPGSRNTTKS